MNTLFNLALRTVRIRSSLLILAITTVILTNFTGSSNASAQSFDSLQGTMIYSQDFESTPAGKLPREVRDDTFAGGPTVEEVVNSGDSAHGKVLKVYGHGFAQLVAGNFSIQKGQLYRVSADIAAPGGLKVTVVMRLIPWGYNAYMQSSCRANETMQHFSFVGAAGGSSANVGIFFVFNGYTDVTIDNIKVETITGPLPPGDSPAPGNLVPNAGFEIGPDGWLTRGPIEFIKSADAFDGQYVAEMAPATILSSTWFRMSYLSDYLVQARFKVIDKTATINVSDADAGTTQTVTPAEGWKLITLRTRPKQPAGAITPFLNSWIGIEDVPGSGRVLVDDCSVQAVDAGVSDVPYTSHARVEIGLSTDAPEGTLTVGESTTATLLASADPGPTVLLIQDEENRTVRRMPLTFSANRSKAILNGLQPGYWHLITAPVNSLRPANSSRVEGESFLAVVPPMPSSPMKDWFYGTHVIDDAGMRKAMWKFGLRWDRLHDTSILTKWFYDEPVEGQFNFHDDERNRHMTEGEALLGNIDIIPGWVPIEPKKPGEPPITQHPIDGLENIAPPAYPLWQEFCRRLAEHQKGHIDTFEVLNESNFLASPEHYMTILPPAAAGLRAGNPNVTIVAPAMGGSIDTGWLLKIVALGAGKYCNVISYHGYALDTDVARSGPYALRTGVAGLRQAMANAGTPGLKIWDSETGSNGPQSLYTKYYLPQWNSAALETARTWAESAACAKAGGIDKIFYYAAFQADVANELGSALWFGDVNHVPYMMLQPLGVAVSFLQGRDYVQDDPTDKARGIVHLIFTGRGATVHVLWRPKGSIIVNVPKNVERTVGMWGRDVPHVHAQMEITQDPVYWITASK